MKCDQDLCLNFWYDLEKLLWQDELNPRVRCAFGNVFSCPGQLNRWHCHSLSEWVTLFDFSVKCISHLDNSSICFNRISDFSLQSLQSLQSPGLHKLWYPGIRDRSTWGKFGAHGEHGDVFLFSNLGALWFSENLIRYSLHVCLREVKNNLFSFKHSYLRHFSWRF